MKAVNIGKGPSDPNELPLNYLRDYIAVITDPSLKTTTRHQNGIHVEAMSDSLDRLKAHMALGVPDIPKATITIYKKVEIDETV